LGILKQVGYVLVVVRGDTHPANKRGGGSQFYKLQKSVLYCNWWTQKVSSIDCATHPQHLATRWLCSHSHASWYTLQHAATRCNTLQHAATHCNICCRHAQCARQMCSDTCSTPSGATQQTARHCKTLQDTATHCNTPLPLAKFLKNQLYSHFISYRKF